MRDVVVYTGLITLRVVLAILGTAYIHPDEYFQNGEVTAGSILGVRSIKTWEWNTAFPCRSISGPWLTTGIPFMVLKMIFNNPVSPLSIFVAERITFLLMSFVLDYCIYDLAPLELFKSLFLLASSSTLLTFQLRPFSNSTEAVLLAISLMVYKRIYERPMETLPLGVFAAIVALGTFSRITFLGFVAPVTLRILIHVCRAHRSIKSWPLVIQLVIPVLVGLGSTIMLVVIDSVYTHGHLQHLVLTPHNLLLYNLSSDNLAKHGLHPRWLHVTVNLPMIMGPTLITYGVTTGRKVLMMPSVIKEKVRSSSSHAVNLTCAYIIITSLVLLSMQPHQEPRFLTPLLVPFIILIGNNAQISRVGKLFWVTTLMFNLVVTLIFGVLHQGGIVRSLFEVHSLVVSHSVGNLNAVVYWKTYMPPWHLLAIPEQESTPLPLVDLAGAPQNEVQATLISLSTPENTTLYLVTPPFAMEGLDSSFQRCFSTSSMIFPHLDMDHLSESMGMGWKKGLSLGIYTANSSCIQKQMTSLKCSTIISICVP